MTRELDLSDLTTEEDLILEVLVARARLGEVCWPFDVRLTKTLSRLHDRGAVTFETHKPTSDCALVWLTDDARAELIKGGYDPKKWLRKDLEDARTHVAWLEKKLHRKQRHVDALDALIEAASSKPASVRRSRIRQHRAGRTARTCH